MSEEKVYGIVVRATIADMIYVQADNERDARAIAVDLVREGDNVVDLDFNANYDNFDVEIDDIYEGEELEGLEDEVGRIYKWGDTTYVQ